MDEPEKVRPASSRIRPGGYLQSCRGTVAVLATFLISRLGYHLLGVRFDSTVLTDDFMQVLPTDLLEKDLPGTLLRLHSQPPLLNTPIGVALKAGGAGPPLMHLLMSAAALSCALGMVALSRELGLRGWMAHLAALVFLVSPASILYENWLFYTMPTATALVWAFVGWLRFRRSGCWRAGSAWLVGTVLLGYAWGLFHLAWIGLAGIFLVRVRRGVLLVSCALGLVTLLYGKNLFLVERFVASSWDGMNLMRVASAGRTGEDIRAAAGSSVIASVPPFSPPGEYGRLFRASCDLRRDHPALCRARKRPTPEKPQPGVNFNHIFYAQAGPEYRAAALRLIWSDPRAYARRVVIGGLRFWNPPADYSYVQPNRIHLPFYDLSARVLYGAGGSTTGSQWHTDEQIRRRVSFGSIGLFGVGLVALVHGASTRPGRRRKLAVARLVGALVFMAPAGFACLVETGENERFRFTFEPIIGCVCVLGLSYLTRGAARLRSSLVRRAARSEP